MELAIGALEYDGNIRNLVNDLLAINPLNTVISEMRCVSGNIRLPKSSKYIERNPKIIDNWKKCRETQSNYTELTFVVPKSVLRANREHIPEDGRMLILTSYPMVKNFVGILTGPSVLGAGYPARKPKNYFLRKISETFQVYGAAIVSNFSHNTDESISLTTAEELGHTFGLDHHGGCIMSGSEKWKEFCSECKNTFSTYEYLV